MKFTVLARSLWVVHWGGIAGGGGLEGSVVKCRLVDGLVFYVRENLARDHFTTSSNARLGMKRGEKSGTVDVLELCCDASRWNEIAAIVGDADRLNRPIRKNRNFSRGWAENHTRSKGVHHVGA